MTCLKVLLDLNINHTGIDIDVDDKSVDGVTALYISADRGLTNFCLKQEVTSTESAWMAGDQFMQQPAMVILM